MTEIAAREVFQRWLPNEMICLSGKTSALIGCERGRCGEGLVEESFEM